MFGEVLWTDDAEAHISRHGVTPVEVEQVLYAQPRIVAPGRDATTLVLGRTDAGRYLFVVVAEAEDGRGFVITARGMTDSEKSGSTSRGVDEMKQDKIDELREYYDDTDVADLFADAELTSDVATEVLVPTSIRLPQSLMQQVGARAAELGIPTTALMRQWIVERASEPTAPAFVAVADLQRFIAERARPEAS